MEVNVDLANFNHDYQQSPKLFQPKRKTTTVRFISLSRQIDMSLLIPNSPF